MHQTANFSGPARAAFGTCESNPAIAHRIRTQARYLPASEITAHLHNAIANATDAAHAHAWEVSLFGNAACDTEVDLEYYRDLVHAWSLVATERAIGSISPSNTALPISQ